MGYPSWRQSFAGGISADINQIFLKLAKFIQRAAKKFVEIFHYRQVDRRPALASLLGKAAVRLGEAIWRWL